MTYGITGNTQKEKLWAPVASLAGWLRQRGLPFCLDEPVAEGLAARHLLPPEFCEQHAVKDLSP
jgi:NAD+ kinase